MKTPITKCEVCDNDFQPKDEFEFICKPCIEKLLGHCCGSDDVQMDWQISDGQLPYYWEIVCSCGREARSPLTSLKDMKENAKDLHRGWCLFKEYVPDER